MSDNYDRCQRCVEHGADHYYRDGNLVYLCSGCKHYRASVGRLQKLRDRIGGWLRDLRRVKASGRD